jgi:hypothetical protein
MREYTWLDRPISWSNLRIFEGILDRLSLASAWLSHARLELPRSKGWLEWASTEQVGSDREAAFREWCEVMIGGRTPEEALLEFGRTARIHEANAAELVMGRDGLGEVSRREGRSAGIRAGQVGSLHVTGASVPSVRSCALAIQQSALGWLDWPSQERPLVERDIPGRLEWVLQECPHQDPVLEGRARRDFLCAQHLEWFRGFSEAIDRRLSIEGRPREPKIERCRIALSWSAEEWA